MYQPEVQLPCGNYVPMIDYFACGLFDPKPKAKTYWMRYIMENGQFNWAPILFYNTAKTTNLSNPQTLAQQLASSHEFDHEYLYFATILDSKNEQARNWCRDLETDFCGVFCMFDESGMHRLALDVIFRVYKNAADGSVVSLHTNCNDEGLLSPTINPVRWNCMWDCITKPCVDVLSYP